MAGHVIVTLLWAAVVLGAIYQAVKPGGPAKANMLLQATGDTINGLTHGLEGK